MTEEMKEVEQEVPSKDSDLVTTEKQLTELHTEVNKLYENIEAFCYILKHDSNSKEEVTCKGEIRPRADNSFLEMQEVISEIKSKVNDSGNSIRIAKELIE